MSQLFIRPMFNDHVVVNDLLARSPGAVRSLRPPIGQLVVDAHVALRRPQFATATADSGIPMLVDPLTPLLQSDVESTDGWLELPYASPEAQRLDTFEPEKVVELVVQTQLEAGATGIIAPYLYAEGPEDPAFSMSIRLLRETRTYLDRERLGLPLLALFCGQLQGFGRPDGISKGIERFGRASIDSGASTVGVCLSPLGNRKDSYAKLSAMARIARTFVRVGSAVVAWRQGVYGPALCAMGFDGYECGIGIGEQTDVRGMQSTRRRSRDPDKDRPVIHGMFLEPLGRSVPLRVANRLLGSIQMRARIVCEDPACCSDVNAMIDNRRQHAVRSRARFLAELNQQPHSQWRLNHVARHARTAITVARHADKVLEAEDAKERVGTKNLEALARLTSELAEAATGEQSA